MHDMGLSSSHVTLEASRAASALTTLFSYGGAFAKGLVNDSAMKILYAALGERRESIALLWRMFCDEEAARAAEEAARAAAGAASSFGYGGGRAGGGASRARKRPRGAPSAEAEAGADDDEHEEAESSTVVALLAARYPMQLRFLEFLQTSPLAALFPLPPLPASILPGGPLFPPDTLNAQLLRAILKEPTAAVRSMLRIVDPTGTIGLASLDAVSSGSAAAGSGGARARASASSSGSAAAASAAASSSAAAAAATAAASSSSAAAAAAERPRQGLFSSAAGPIVKGILASGVITQLHLLSLGWTPEPHDSDEEGEADIVNRADDAAEGGKGARKKDLNKDECKRIIREYNDSKPASRQRVKLTGNIGELRARVAAIRNAFDEDDDDEDDGGTERRVGFVEHDETNEGAGGAAETSMSVDPPVQPPPHGL